MLRIKKPMFAMLAFMLVLEVTLSVIFNVLVLINMVPPRLRYYFFVLFFGAVLFLFITGYVMRKLYKRLISASVKHKSDRSDKSKTTGDSAKRHALKPYDKKYYSTTIGACAIFMAIVYSVRIFVGPMPFKWTCALTNFANFTGRFKNVYFSISIFGVLLFATVFAAQIGVKSSKKKHAKQWAKQYRKYREQRNDQAEQMTRVFRENEAEAKGVDLYDLERWHKHKHRHRSQERKDAEKRSEALRGEEREGVDVLGAVLKRSKSSKTNEELEKRSEELRREKREGVDVLGAVITNGHKKKNK